MLMCSYVCPCDATKATKWTLMTEDDLKEYSRTKLPPAVAGDSNKNPLTDDDGNYRLVVYQPGAYDGKLYDVFLDCHNDLAQKKEEAEVSRRRLQVLSDQEPHDNLSEE